MMGVVKCKDLDEWLMGSGESNETADSKKNQVNKAGNPDAQPKFGVKSTQNTLV
jgi:hypothetical protein